MTNDPKNPEYNAKVRDAIMDLCPFYDPNHKCGIVRENVFKDCLAELRERERLALESARIHDALSSAGMKQILQLEQIAKANQKAAIEAGSLLNRQGAQIKELHEAYENETLSTLELAKENSRLERDLARALASESQREAAESADEKSDGQAENVKEHATLSAGASVDHGVEVESMQEHENKAADRGCVSRLVRNLFLHAGLVFGMVDAVTPLSPSPSPGSLC